MSSYDEFDATIDDQINMYKEGYSMLEIAEIYKMSKQAIWKRLHKHNVKIRSLKEALLNSYYRGRWHKIGGPGGVG